MDKDRELELARKVVEAARELVMGRTMFRDNLGKALQAYDEAKNEI